MEPKLTSRTDLATVFSELRFRGTHVIFRLTKQRSVNGRRSSSATGERRPHGWQRISSAVSF